MKLLGNLLWIILCGLWLALAWLIIGIIWCVTIIGIPVGVQCIKMSGLAFAPFGKKIIYGEKASAVIINILWLFLGGIELALGHLIAGIVFCVTIIGIPFGLQCFKMAKLALLPFGATVVTEERKTHA